jgi:hypothetical protein
MLLISGFLNQAGRHFEKVLLLDSANKIEFGFHWCNFVYLGAASETNYENGKSHS